MNALASNHGTFPEAWPRTAWITEDGPDRDMSLLEAFWFRDPDGRRWEVEVEYRIDGASIPRALWSLIGSPYTGDYRRASIVHDRACDGVSGAERKAADRMFFHACRAGGCSRREATILYIGVRIGAWLSRVPAWRGALDRDAERPRTSRSSSEMRVEADFGLIAERVLAAGDVDDPIVLERLTDAAMAEVLGLDRQAIERG